MVVVDPKIVQESVVGTAARLVLIVPNDLTYFDGHFLGAPVVPGVVQVKWAIENARRCFELLETVAGMEVLKFQRVIQPGAEITLALEYSAQTGKVHFSFESQQGRHSSGRIVFLRSS